MGRNQQVTDARPPHPIRVAMLARVVFPLHGFGGIERHVFHLVTHLTRLGVGVRLYVQPPPQPDAERWQAWQQAVGVHAPTELVLLRYDYTTPVLRPNSIIGRQINYPLYTWQLGAARSGGGAAR